MNIRHIVSCAVLCGFLSIVLPGTHLAAMSSNTANASRPASISIQPTLFIENAGQYDTKARYQVRTANNVIWLSDEAIWITLIEQPVPDFSPNRQNDINKTRTKNLKGVNVRLSFVDANPHPKIEPFNPQSVRLSFFEGNNTTKWQANVPVWGGVRYRELYPGIDLELTGSDGCLTPKIVLRPGAKLNAVRLRIEGINSLQVQQSYLRLVTDAGDIRFPLIAADIPHVSSLATQYLGTGDFEVTAPFTDIPNDSIPLGSASSPTPYSTYLGLGEGRRIAVDESDAAYVLGMTSSAIFPVTPGSFDTILGGLNDVFVLKLNAAGSSLLYATFLGGSGTESAEGIAVDSDGAAYVTGYTDSQDFPTTPSAFDRTSASIDAFVTKLNPTGTALEYSTFLGGNLDWDQGKGIAIDSDKAAYVVGTTWSSDFPATQGAFDTTYGGDGDAFVAKLNPLGTALNYATFIGGIYQDRGEDIALGISQTVYIVGPSFSTDYPITPGAYDTIPPQVGTIKSFATALNATGSDLVYSTFLNGGSNVYNSDAVDAAGSAYVAFKSSVLKLNPSGTNLEYAYSLPGLDDTYNTDVAVDDYSRAYITGYTSWEFFHTTPGAFDRTFGGLNNCSMGTCTDAFLVRLHEDGSEPTYSTFLSGAKEDQGFGIAINRVGVAYVTGGTLSSDFPTTSGAYSSTLSSGSSAAFAARIPIFVDLQLTMPSVTFSTAAATSTIPIQFHQAGNTVATSVTLTASLSAEITYLSDDSGITPEVQGNDLVWHLPDLDFQGTGQFALQVAIPITVPLGSRFPLAITISSHEVDFDFVDNHVLHDVVVPFRTHLAILAKNSLP